MSIALKAGSEFGRVGVLSHACAGFLQAGERGIGIFGADGGDVFHPAPCVFEQQQMNASRSNGWVSSGELRVLVQPGRTGIKPAGSGKMPG